MDPILEGLERLASEGAWPAALPMLLAVAPGLSQVSERADRAEIDGGCFRAVGRNMLASIPLDDGLGQTCRGRNNNLY